MLKAPSKGFRVHPGIVERGGDLVGGGRKLIQRDHGGRGPGLHRLKPLAQLDFARGDKLNRDLLNGDHAAPPGGPIRVMR